MLSWRWPLHLRLLYTCYVRGCSDPEARAVLGRRRAAAAFNRIEALWILPRSSSGFQPPGKATSPLTHPRRQLTCRME